MDETKRKKPLVDPQYIVKCRGCGKRLRDPEDNLIYVVRAKKPRNKKTDEGEYWCSQKCMNTKDTVRKEAIKNAREC